MTTQPASDKARVAAIREQMPSTTDIHYLNTGTYGPMPKVTADAIREMMEREYRKGRYLPFLAELYEEMYATRTLLARIVGASCDEIALTHCATESLNIVLWGLHWLPGDEVITTSLEHVASLAPLSLVKARKGIIVKYVEVKYGDDYDEEEFIGCVERMITPRTRLLVISHVATATGTTFPIKKLVEICHAHHVYVLVDGAQAAGAVPVDIRDLGADFYAMTARKWLLGPEGVGALYVAKDRISELDPTFISPASVKNRSDLDMVSPYVVPAPFAARYQLATAMYRPTLLGFHKSLEYLLDSVGMEWIYARIRRLARHMQGLLRDIPGVKVVTPLGKEAGLLGFHVEGWRPHDLCVLLQERGFMVRPEPEHQLPAPARISTGFYNTEEELEQLAQAIEDIVT